MRNALRVAQKPSLATIFKIFLIAGAISFGGGVVAYLREYLVRDEHWLDDDQFLDALGGERDPAGAQLGQYERDCRRPACAVRSALSSRSRG